MRKRSTPRKRGTAPLLFLYFLLLNAGAPDDFFINLRCSIG